MDELPQVAILPPRESRPNDWVVVVTLKDGRKMEVLIPIPDGKDDWLFGYDEPFGLNLTFAGHYGS